jgi:hypothetical protein
VRIEDLLASAGRAAEGRRDAAATLRRAVPRLATYVRAAAAAAGGFELSMQVRPGPPACFSAALHRSWRSRQEGWGESVFRSVERGDVGRRGGAGERGGGGRRRERERERERPARGPVATTAGESLRKSIPLASLFSLQSGNLLT